jgi:predicted NUDIX family phosphoesterase
MYTTAVKREVEEEVIIDTDYTDNIVALLNDESNEVGSVHLGVVHFWNLSEPKVNRREQMITQMEFMTPQQLNEVKDSMETWSQICLNGLTKMTEKSK